MRRRWTRRAALAAAAAGGLALLGGCATNQTLAQARDAFGQARQAGAEARAPYDYAAAEVYLDLAEHEWREFDYPQTAVYAEKALDHAKKAAGSAGGGDR